MESKEKLEQELKETLAAGGNIKQKVQEITEDALSRTEATREAVRKTIQTTTENIKEIISCANVEFGGIMSDVSDGIVDGASKTGHKITDLKEDITAFFTAKTEKFDFEDVKDKTKSAFFSAFDKFTDIAEDVLEDLKEKKEEWKKDIQEKAADVAEDIEELKVKASEKAEDVLEDIQEFKADATEKAEGMLGNIQSAFAKKPEEKKEEKAENK